MKKISKWILSIILVLLVSVLVYNVALDLKDSHSITQEVEEHEKDDLEQIEDASKKVEEANEKKESNGKVLFYTGIVLGIFLIGGMLIVFISKSDD